MKKILSFLILVLSFATVICAQEYSSWKTLLTGADKATWKGVRFSYDHTNFRYSGGNDMVRLGYNGFSLGYVQSFLLGRKLPLFLETGAGVNFLRHSYDGSDDVIVNKYSTNVFALSVPVNVVYKIEVTDRISIKPYTGLYLRANLMAKQNAESGLNGKTYEDDVNLFDGDSESWKRVQLGWDVGVTAGYSRYNIGIGYAIDFNKIAYEAKLGTLSVRLGMNL